MAFDLDNDSQYGQITWVETKSKTKRSTKRAADAQNLIIRALDKSDIRVSAELRASLLRIAQTVHDNVDRTTFLRSLLASLFDDRHNEERAEYNFLEQISRTNGWPFPSYKINALDAAKFVKDGNPKPSASTILAYFFAVSLLVLYDHPCIKSHVAYSMIKLSHDLEIIGRYLETGERSIQEEQITRLGDGLYRFLEYNQSPQRHAELAKTKLLAGAEDARLIPSSSSHKLMAIRPSGQENSYLISHGKIASIKSIIGHDEQSYLYIYTMSEKRYLSHGFVLTNASGDVYFYQYQPDARGFNITFIPQAELSMPAGFAKALILTYDDFSYLGGMASRIALTHFPKFINISGIVDRRTLIDNLHNEYETGFDVLELENYLKYTNAVTLIGKSDKFRKISTWKQLKDYLNAEEVDDEEIIGYSRSTIRTG